MLPITVYNQGGGHGKSTMSRDLAAAFAEKGLEVLIISFDSQDRSVCKYLDVDDDKKDSGADDITLHLTDRAKGPFEDLIRTPFDDVPIDVIPSHKRFGTVDDSLDKHASHLEIGQPDDWEYPRHERLLHVLQKNNIRDKYDVLLVDPNAKTDEAFYLALYATRNILMPAESNSGALMSIEGAENAVENFSEAKDITVTNLGVIPTRVSMSKNKHKETAKKIQAEYTSPVYIKNLTAIDNAAGERETIFKYLKSEERRIPPSTEDVMPKLRTLAAHIANRTNFEVPNGGWDQDELWLGNDFWGDVDTDTLAISEPTVTGVKQ